MDENSVARQLDILTVPFGKHFRYPLPVPQKLAREVLELHPEDSSLISSPHMKHSLNSERSSPMKKSGSGFHQANELEEKAAVQEVYQQSILDTTMKNCLEQIPSYSTWMEQIQKSVKEANESSLVLVDVLSGIRSMRAVTQTVQEQSSAVHRETSTALARRTQMERFRDEMRKTYNHFLHMDNLYKESQNPLLSAESDAFPTLLEGIATEMNFLSQSTTMKSYESYKSLLTVAQQTAIQCLTKAVKNALQESFRFTTDSFAFRRALDPSLPVPEGEDDIYPQLDMDRIEDSFSQFLLCVNKEYLRWVTEKSTLRRMLELHRAPSASSQNEALLMGAMNEIDPYALEVLTSYRETRVSIIGPLLRRWLTLWYNQATDIHAGPFVIPQGTATETLQKTEEQGPKEASPPSSALVELSAGREVIADRSLPEITTEMCSFLEICLEAEKEMVEEVWLREDFISFLMPQLVSFIADEVYHVFRSRLLQVDSMEELSDTIRAIQRIQLMHDTTFSGARDIGSLWIRMIQDAQERLFFRTSVYLRQYVVHCRPTKANAVAYLKLFNPSPQTAEPDTSVSTSTVPRCDDPAFFLDGVLNAVRLLALLYPTLEFSVFSVFAEESVHAALVLLQELSKLMQQEVSQDADAPVKALLCQLAHLLFLRQELSHIDVNTTVVENTLDFTKLRQRRLEIVQSKKDSKKDVESEFVTCIDRLTQTMLSLLTQPMTGVALKDGQSKKESVGKMQSILHRYAAMVPVYVCDKSVEQQIMKPVIDKCTELTKEVEGEAAQPNP